MDAQQQAADLGRVVASLRVAAHHELLPQLALELEPGLAAPRHIGRIGPLGDDAFQLHLAGRSQDRRRVGREVGTEADVLGGTRFKESLKQASALAQRHLAKVMTLKEGRIEDKVHDAISAFAMVERVLQRVEVRVAVVAQHHDFTIEERRVQPERGEFLHQRRHLRLPVVPAARDQRNPALMEARHDPVAIELKGAPPKVLRLTG